MTEPKEHIIEIAYNLFFKYGISSVTMDYIAKECGISKRTLYEYFDDKTTLISSIIIYGHQKEARKFEEIINESGNALVSLLELYERNRQFVINVNKTFFTDLRRLYPKIAGEFATIRESYLSTLSKVLEIGQSQDLFRKEINTKIVANLLLSLMDTIRIVGEKLESTYPIADIYSISIDCFIRGILTTKGTEIYLQYLKRYKK